MVIEKLNPINRDDLKVGDVVGVAREIRCGWGISMNESNKIAKEILNRLGE